MFTGLIEEIGEVVAVPASDKGTQLQIAAPGIAKKSRNGDSIAVNGGCHTSTSLRSKRLTFDLLEDTNQRTNFKKIPQTDRRTIEPAFPAALFLGVHIGTGHI